MTDIVFKPFGPQKEFLLSKERIRCMFASKRAGKSEPGYIDTIIKGDQQPGYIDNNIDPYMMAIVAPTNNMLSTLVWPKFRAFAKPFEGEFIASRNEFRWRDKNTVIYGVTAEKIQRLEGKKISHIHITEAFQMNKNVLLESIARVSDTRGSITIDGSLGPNIPNPKQHWIYKMFIEKHMAGSEVWQWYTKDNPYFPQDELARLKNTLDPLTFRQLFEMDWDVMPENAVYSDFSEDNIIQGYVPSSDRETYISVDWGYAHPAAVGFFQYDYEKDTVYLFDEIVQNKLTIDKLYRAILAKLSVYRNIRINEWICDIAGDQEREQTGRSNVAYFKKQGIYFKKRRTAVQYGIPIVRSYIKDGMGRRKFLIDGNRCPHSIDGIKRYHYKEKDGIILNENPVKIDDDACDMVRYLYVNMLDHSKVKDSFSSYKMW